MTEQDKEQLRLEISHIFESGVNEIRVQEMVENFIEKREKAIAVNGCCKSDSEQLFAVLRYAMPDQFTDVSLKNIVKGFEEQSK